MPSPLLHFSRDSFQHIPRETSHSLAKPFPKKRVSGPTCGSLHVSTLQGQVSPILPQEGVHGTPAPCWVLSHTGTSILHIQVQVTENTYGSSILKPDSFFGLFKTKHIAHLMRRNQQSFSHLLDSQNFPLLTLTIQKFHMHRLQCSIYKLSFLIESTIHLQLMDHNLLASEKENSNFTCD